MKIAKLIAVRAATIALSLATVTTFTGCEDVLGESDTVSIEKLGVAFVEEVSVLSDASADIVVSGSFQKKEKFAGFAVLSAPAAGDSTDLTKIISTKFVELDSSAVDSWTSEMTLMVDIASIDTDQEWWISAINDDMEMGQSVPATFYGRVSTSADAKKYDYGVATLQDGVGLDVDMNVVTPKAVEGSFHAGTNAASYATNYGGDIMVEGLSTGGVGMTPIGGAVVFAVEATTQLTDAEVSAIYAASYSQPITVSNGFVVFAQGKTVRVGADVATAEAGEFVALAVGQEYYVITSALDVARLVVTTVDEATGAVTFTTRKASGMNTGLQLRSAN